MSKELSLKGIFLEAVNRILNPKFEFKFILMLASTGTVLILYQRLMQIFSSLEWMSGKTYIRLSLQSGTDMAFVIIGIVLLISSILLFIWVRLSGQQKANKKYRSLADAAKEIRPLLDDNRRIFTAFGPNSECSSVEELRLDYEVWEQLKKEQIVPNNDEILSILKRVKFFSPSEVPIVNAMKSHISAFKEHCQNPNFDYSKNQFPLGFADLIFSYEKENKNNIATYKSWLEVALSDQIDEIESVYIFGSSLYGREASDVDVIIKNKLIKIDEIKAFSENCKNIRECFKNEFSLSLHLKVFSNIEIDSFNNFLGKIYKFEKVI